jgi:MFS family permease
MATTSSLSVSAPLLTHPAQSPAPEPSAYPQAFRALRHRNYRLYFAGQVVSLTGSWIQTAALTWLAYDLTKQSSWAGMILAGQILPTLLLGAWAGGLADRFSRRPLIFMAQSALLILALCLALMVWLNWVTPVGLLVMSLLLGVANAIDTPARLAFVADMVGREDLMNAVALNSLIFNLARTVGPAIGGLILPWLGPGGCFLVNALTFSFILAALMAMVLPPKPPRYQAITHATLSEGFRHLARRADLLLLLFLASVLAFLGWPVLSLLPAIADHQLQASQEAYAWMLSALGGGALLGAYVVAAIGTPARRRVLIGCGVGCAMVGVCVLAFAVQVVVAIGAALLAGFGMILFFATGQATMQLGASEHNRGRVMGIWLMCLAGAQPAGNLVMGYLADHYGTSWVLLLQAIGILLAGLIVWAFSPPLQPLETSGS